MFWIAALFVFELLSSDTSGGTWHFPDQSQFAGPLTLITPDWHVAGRIYTSGHGVFRSDDFGQTWLTLDRDLRLQYLFADPSTPDRLYAASGGSLLRSVDAATTWTAIPTPRKLPSFLVIDAAGILYATDPEGSFRSADGGDTWSPVMPVPLGGAPTSADPATPGLLYAVSCPLVGGFFFCGIYRTQNGAGSWEGPILEAGVFEQVRRIESSAVTPRTVYVALTAHDLGSSSGVVLASHDRGDNWDRVFLTADLGSIATDPIRSSVFYVSALRYALSKNTVGVYEVSPERTTLLGQKNFAVSRLAVARDGSVLYAINTAGELATLRLVPPPRPQLVRFR